MSTPLENAAKLRAIADLNTSLRMNIGRAWATEIADQLLGMDAEHKKVLALLCQTEQRLACALLKKWTER